MAALLMFRMEGFNSETIGSDNRGNSAYCLNLKVRSLVRANPALRIFSEMTLNRRTGSGSDLAGSLHSTFSLLWLGVSRCSSASGSDVRLSLASRPGRYCSMFCS
jgi:hypothetical protein